VDGLHLTAGRTWDFPRLGDFLHMLANLCLDVLRRPATGRGHPTGPLRRRFRDPHEEPQAAERAYALTEETLASLRLRLNEGKTRVVRFSEGFRFLG